MLCQVCFLCIRFATVLANVRFQVLRVFVLRDVLEQRWLVAEAFVARVTFKRFVGLMATRVRLQIGQLRKCFLAAGVTAFVRFVAGMGANVLLQMRQLCKFALAYFATVWFDAQMDAGVLRQIAGIGERL